MLATDDPAAVGYATLTGTGGLVVVFAIDSTLAGQTVGPAYAYFLAGSVSIGVGTLAGMRCFRRARGPGTAGPDTLVR